MIQLISKVCTACLGSGEIEGVQKVARNPENLLDIPGEIEVPRDLQKCYICNGEGHFYTGYFIYTPTDMHKSFEDELSELDPDILKIIMKAK